MKASLTHSHPPSTHTHEREEIRKEEHRKKKRRGEERGRKERKDEEIRRGCSVAAETPPPLLGLVAFVVLPPSGCCSAAKELEGSTPCHQVTILCSVSSLSRSHFSVRRYNDLMLRIFSKHPDLFPEEANLLTGIVLFMICSYLIAPQSASGVVLDAPEASRLLSAVAIAMSNSLRDYARTSSYGFCAGVVDFLFLDASFNRNNSSEVSSPVVGPCNCYSCNCLPSINQNGGGGAVSVALVLNQNAGKVETTSELVHSPKILHLFLPQLSKVRPCYCCSKFFWRSAFCYFCC
ncbi:uncharacterized protein DS421_17g587780 [Arachis hypogaea]|nr:uncharacterized protein DS421_17g587780 [Arachis hypogaea]